MTQESVAGFNNWQARVSISAVRKKTTEHPAQQERFLIHFAPPSPGFRVPSSPRPLVRRFFRLLPSPCAVLHPLLFSCSRRSWNGAYLARKNRTFYCLCRAQDRIGEQRQRCTREKKCEMTEKEYVKSVRAPSPDTDNALAHGLAGLADNDDETDDTPETKLEKNARTPYTQTKKQATKCRKSTGKSGKG